MDFLYEASILLETERGPVTLLPLHKSPSATSDSAQASVGAVYLQVPKDWTHPQATLKKTPQGKQFITLPF